VIDSIQKGIKVVIAEDEFSPESSLRESKGYNQGTRSFKEQIKKYRNIVTSYGVEFIKLEDLVEKVVSEFIEQKPYEIKTGDGRREVVTNEDVLLFYRSKNKVINVSIGAIITPLARDTAKELGIEFTYNSK